MPRDAFHLTFRAFQKSFLELDKIQRNYYRKSQIALSLIGRNHRQTARKKIKMRRATPGQWARYKAARESGNEAAASRIMDAMTKKHQQTSRPGQPPFSHVADHAVSSLRAIYYAALPRSVVIGPVKARRGLRGSSAGTVPELMEFGGVATVTRKLVRKQGRDKRGRVLPPKLTLVKTGPRKVNIAARPFMAPTLTDELSRNKSVIAKVFNR